MRGNPMNANVIAILKSARGEVAKGWCKNILQDSRGNVCGLGAIIRADRGSVTKTLTGDGLKAVVEVSRHIPGGGSLPAYNNARARIQQDMLDLFDKTLADLGGLA